MNTYKLTFDNGAKFQVTTENLDQAHSKIIPYMEKNELTKCVITCPNGAIRTVQKTGNWHWNHNGYTFN
jgi:hypothetical protein